jgi:hypothetical protein
MGYCGFDQVEVFSLGVNFTFLLRRNALYLTAHLVARRKVNQKKHSSAVGPSQYRERPDFD